MGYWKSHGLLLILYRLNRDYIYKYITNCVDYKYTITWLLCAFSLVVDQILEDTHTDGVKSTSDHVSRLVSIFSCPPNPSINHLNFYCIKQIDYIFPCMHVYCNRSQKTSQRVKNSSHATRLHLVSHFFVLYKLWRHLWSITVHAHEKM